VLFFLVLPALLKAGWKFAPALCATSVVMMAAYAAYSFVLSRFGIKI
jgi:hypothetical protein